LLKAYQCLAPGFPLSRERGDWLNGGTNLNSSPSSGRQPSLRKQLRHFYPPTRNVRTPSPKKRYGNQRGPGTYGKLNLQGMGPSHATLLLPVLRASVRELRRFPVALDAGIAIVG